LPALLHTSAAQVQLNPAGVQGPGVKSRFIGGQRVQQPGCLGRVAHFEGGLDGVRQGKDGEDGFALPDTFGTLVALDPDVACLLRPASLEEKIAFDCREQAARAGVGVQALQTVDKIVAALQAANASSRRPFTMCRRARLARTVIVTSVAPAASATTSA
jgi:hypothetical protein